MWKGSRFSCIPYKVFRDFHQCWQILSYPSDPSDRYKMNNNTCCQCIGCIGGHVTLSLRRWELTSLRITYDVSFQYGRRQHVGMRLVNGDSFVKFKRWRSKGMQEKELSWLFGADRKICPSGSLCGITRQSLVMSNSDHWTDFSVRISHPGKIFVFSLLWDVSIHSITLHMSRALRKCVFYVTCKEQRRRSACTPAQSDQRLCCSLLR